MQANNTESNKYTEYENIARNIFERGFLSENSSHNNDFETRTYEPEPWKLIDKNDITFKELKYVIGYEARGGGSMYSAYQAMDYLLHKLETDKTNGVRYTAQDAEPIPYCFGFIIRYAPNAERSNYYFHALKQYHYYDDSG